MQHELYYYLIAGIRSRLTNCLAALTAITLVSFVPTTKSEPVKIALLMGAGACSVIGLINSREQVQSTDALEDFRAITSVKRQQRLLWQSASGKTVDHTADEPLETLELFDLTSIGDKRDEFPNVFIIGAPGSGKTSAAEYLGCVLKAGKRYAVHPHAKPTDFKGFDRILGGGRNIGTADDEPCTWENITENQIVPSIAQVIIALHTLMNDRYQRYYLGESGFETIDVYFDELPAISMQLGKKFLSQYLPSLIMECRKVGIRLWFLSQAFQIKALGLEGISDLREGATVIRLGKLAKKEAQTLVRTKRISSSVVDFINSHDRPVLVDDMPARLPLFSEMNAAILAYCKSRSTKLEVKPLGTLTAAPNSTLSLTPASDESLEESLEESLPHLTELSGLGDKILEAFDRGDTPTLTRAILKHLRQSSHPQSDLAHELVYRLAERRLSEPSNVIIKRYWGFNGKTEVYHRGLTLAKELGLRYSVEIPGLDDKDEID